MEYPQYHYAVIGGDMRQVYLTEELAHHQNRVIYYALKSRPDESRCSDASFVAAAAMPDEAFSSAPCIICPIPFAKNGIYLNQYCLEEDLLLSDLLNLLKPGQTFFAGCIPKDFKDAATDHGVTVIDQMEDDTLAVYNTIATAEGAICEALKRSPLNLHKSKCAVLGYGRCGRTLVNYLKGMYCNVYVYTRQQKELAIASTVADGIGKLAEFQTVTEDFDFIFNTIPAKVLTTDILNKMKKSATIIDIASAPGGVDYTAAHLLGLEAAFCPGLPGKYAPSSSAKAIKKSIEKALTPNI